MIEPEPSLPIPDRRQERLASVGSLAVFAALLCLPGLRNWLAGGERPLGEVFLALGMMLFSPMGVGGARSRYVGGPLRAKAGLATAASLPHGAASSAASLVFLIRGESFLLCGVAALLLLLSLMCAAWMVKPGPVLVVDAQGFYDRRALRRPLRWDEILAFDVVNWRGATLYRLAIESTDQMTLMARWSTRTGFDGIAIGCNGLDCSDRDIIDAIRANRPELIGDDACGTAA